jgi:hypothetical protein
MTHPFVESYSEYAAVLLRTDSQLAKEDRWISRCFMTCGFTEVDITDELAFAHAESGVQITCDSDALAIDAGASSQALRQCYSDLFTVLKNMGWAKVEVHTDADVEEVIAEMAAYIPASYDLTMEAGAAAERTALVNDLRAEILTRQAEQGHELGHSNEAAVPMASLHIGSQVEERPASPAAEQAPLQAAEVSRDRSPSSPQPRNTAAGGLEEAVRLMAHGQQQMQQQFAGLMALLASGELGIKRFAQPVEAHEATSSPQTTSTPPVRPSMERAGQLATQRAQEREQTRSPDQVTVEATATHTSDVGIIPASPDDQVDARSTVDAIGTVPPHPDEVPASAPAPAMAPSAEGTLQAQEPRVPQQPSRSEISNARPDSAGVTQLDGEGTPPSHQPLTDQQQQLISAITMVVQTALTEVFMLRNAVDRLGDARASTGA